MLEITCAYVCFLSSGEIVENHLGIAGSGCQFLILPRRGVGIQFHLRGVPRKDSFWITVGGLSQRHGKGPHCLGKGTLTSPFVKKGNTHLPYNPVILLLGIYSTENICPFKDLHMNTYNSFIHDSLKLDTTQIPMNKRTNEQIMA